MYFPTYYVNNFYENPEKVLDFANSLEYYPSEGNYPGKRTKHLHEVSPDFFNYSCFRVLNMIFGKSVSNVSFVAKNTFQKINYNDISISKKGWIHIDPQAKLTVIIYLTPGKSKSGTSIYETKTEGIGIIDQTLKYELKQSKDIPKFFDFDKKFHNLLEKDELKKKLEENNSRFNTLATFNCKFNSMLAFDGSNFHGADFEDLEEGETRLTQVIFFNEILSSNYPIPDMRRTC
jgi:hypothetical protein